MVRRNYMLLRKCAQRFIIIISVIILFSSACIVYAADNEQLTITQISSADSTEAQKDSADKSYNVFSDLIAPVSLEFLGAFLGVLTALWLNAHANKKQYKELNESLYNELLTLEIDLDKRFKEKQDYYRYLIPIWDINLASGNLSVLANRHIDKKYIEIYSKIQYAQELEREYIHSKLLKDHNNDDFLNAYIATVDTARIREAQEIKKMIVKLNKREVK